jgi:hypothetical protein
MFKTNNNKCPRADEILSYMYGETVSTGETEFETHLADCAVCTDEFAAVSDSRFSVYEWKKEAFDPLPTPHITVALAPAAEATAGLSTTIKAWVKSLSFPVAAAAAVAVCIGIGVIAISFIGNNQQPVISRVDVPVVPPETAPEIVPPINVTAPEPTRGSRSEVPRPVRAWTSVQRVRKVLPGNDRPINNVAIRPVPTQQIKAPALTAFQENDDSSLRLSDLFEEVGG